MDQDQHQYDRWWHWSTKTNDERIPHVTARHRPPRHGAGSLEVSLLQSGGGGARLTNQHSMLVSLWPGGVRAARPTCGGSSTASERGTAANALYACLTFMGNSSGEVGEGARGCRGGGGGVVMEGGGVGSYGRRSRGGVDTQTDREMEERADYEKNQQSWRRLWRRTGEQHGGWFHVREEGSMPEKDGQ